MALNPTTPPIMNPEDKLSQFFRLNDRHTKALSRLGLNTIKDLLYHFPRYYADTAEARSIESLKKGETAVIFGKISGLKTKKAFRRKIPMAEGIVEDSTGKIKIVWFHQAYLAKMIGEGQEVRVEGKVSERKGALYFSNPKIEEAPTLFSQKGEHYLYPIYPETRGLTSNWIHHTIKKILPKVSFDADAIPKDILKRYSLPDLKTSLIYIHTPKERGHAEAARKRFSFEEILLIQLEKEQVRQELRKKSSLKIETDKKDLLSFTERFPFKMTDAQKRAAEAISKDFLRGHPMSRLLEGDVGSGKTAVAATASYAVIRNGFQVAYMAPTEILARQHFESFIKYFSPPAGGLPINIALITGSGCRKFPSKVNPQDSTNISRSQLLKWVANGEIQIVLGTHALIEKSVKFKRLALAIVDEQHRFGVKQRQKLISKEGDIPHLLSMTATPIPRTLALTLYGDLDLTLLDEMPEGRKKIATEIVSPEGRLKAYEEIRKELRNGRQLYVICPRIDEPDPTKELAIQAKSVKKEAKRLKEDVFPEYRIAILHSKMKPAEKEKVMMDFEKHEIDILVSTSVVEVGVNVENASLIIIEGAERFGLAQLHQLRGRVLRGTHQPYCFILTESNSRATVARLDALKRAKDGFELAEFDLENRGAGSLSGIKQWGISDIGMDAIKNLKMVEAARHEAQRLVAEDSGLSRYPTLLAHMESKQKKIHFE